MNVTNNINHSRGQPLRRVHLVLASLASIAVVLLWGAAPANAMNQDCLSSHCFSIVSSGITNATGALITDVHANNMYVNGVSSSNKYFITSGEKLQTPGGRSWIETGLVDGWGMDLNRQVYALYAYARGADTGYSSGWWYIDYISPTGATHTFQISRGTAANTFSVWADGVTSVPDFTSGNLGFWQGEPVVGAECYGSKSDGAHADTFNMYHSYVTNTGSVAQWPSGNRSISVHAGMNGVDNSTYWAWNAP